MLTARSADLVTADKARAINRLRGTLLKVSPALVRALDMTRTGPRIVIRRYAIPAASRENDGAVMICLRPGSSLTTLSTWYRAAAELAATAGT